MVGETVRIYDSDYKTFVERENDLMAKLEQSVQITASLTQRIKDFEYCLMAQIQESRNISEQQQYHMAGDLREEFARAICRELEFESSASTKRVQDVNIELVELVTRSNEYHTARHFVMVEDVKDAREMCQTLKQSIAMVDAELSDTKEKVDFVTDEIAQTSNDVFDIKEDVAELKDDVYHEMDRDYYDLKDFVKRRLHRHNKQKHAVVEDAAAAAAAVDPLQMIVSEYAENTDSAVEAAATPVKPAYTEHVIIIDATTFISDDEDEFQHM
jgi:hypothetical protein